MYNADHKGPFFKHRVALSPLAHDFTGQNASGVLREVSRLGECTFANFLREQKLASCWHHFVVERDVEGEISPAFLDALKQARLAEAAFYLGQKSALQELDYLFASQGIVYAAIKGAHVRERVYADPALRPASDIDILISPHQREAAAQVLIAAGFRLEANADNISHEATFTRGAIAIDLHWDILRPGRTRVEMVPSLLSRRERVEYFWGLCDEDSIFLLLVHPAFAKYVCSPNMGLISVVDFLLFLQKRQVDWSTVSLRLDEAGLKVAAWTVLKWFAMLVKPEDLPVPASFIIQISPGPARSRYLAYWLQHDLPTRWFEQAFLVQFGLTLMLHDRPSDAARAVSGWTRARRTRNADPLLQMSE